MGLTSSEKGKRGVERNFFLSSPKFLNAPREGRRRSRAGRIESGRVRQTGGRGAIGTSLRDYALVSSHPYTTLSSLSPISFSPPFATPFLPEVDRKP